MPAVVRALTALLPADAQAAVHAGATSQDIIDTAVMLLAGRAIAAISADLATAADQAAELARAQAGTVMAGRTLLQQAVPVTFGLVAAGWLTGIGDARRELDRFRATRLAVQFGGAAGTLASLGMSGPTVAALLAARARTWPSPRCPGIPTGCGSSSLPRPWPACAPAWARLPGT